MPVEGLKATAFWETPKEFPKVLVAEILGELWRIVSSNTPQNAVLRHVEFGNGHHLTGIVGRTLGALLESLPANNDPLAQLTHQAPGFNYNKEHIVNTS